LEVEKIKKLLTITIWRGEKQKKNRGNKQMKKKGGKKEASKEDERQVRSMKITLEK